MALRDTLPILKLHPQTFSCDLKVIFLQQPEPSGLVSSSMDSTHIVFSRSLFPGYFLWKAFSIPEWLDAFRSIWTNLPLGHVTSPYVSTDASNLNPFAIDHGEASLSPVFPEISDSWEVPPPFCVPENDLPQKATSPWSNSWSSLSHDSIRFAHDSLVYLWEGQTFPFLPECADKTRPRPSNFPFFVSWMNSWD